MVKTVLAGVGATALLAITVLTIRWYVWDIAIGQAGAADRSMLFWGLPVLIVGVFSAMGAGVLVFVILRSRKS